nr:MAG TPA: hypothetical protein [Caudoviricetes sp.]
MEEKVNIKIGLKRCEECVEENKLFEILKILQWRGNDNYLSALAFDEEAREILVNEDSLMRAIQMANPGQQYRGIKLIKGDEFQKIVNRDSDFTCDREQVRKENMAL